MQRILGLMALAALGLSIASASSAADLYIDVNAARVTTEATDESLAETHNGAIMEGDEFQGRVRIQARAGSISTTARGGSSAITNNGVVGARSFAPKSCQGAFCE